MFGLHEIRRCRSAAEARQLGLVLTAQGIPSRIVPLGNGVALCVKAEDVDAAAYELDAYDAENAPPPRPAPRWRPQGGGLEASLAYIALLVFVFAAEQRGAFGWDWMARGAADTAAIRAGAWWQTLTALTLHVDVEHLLSNVVFGGVAGALVVHSLGAGVGWFAIAVAGALGNAFNAIVLQDPGHISVGASTAVFAALGLLSGHTQRYSNIRNPWRRGLRRFAPAFAGVLLLAFLGFGTERTDVGAHVAGFVVGLLLGLALWRLPRRWQRGGWQVAAGLAAPVLILAGWLVAKAG